MLINSYVVDTPVGKINMVQISVQAASCFGVRNTLVQRLLSVFIRDFLAKANPLLGPFGGVPTDFDCHAKSSFLCTIL